MTGSQPPPPQLPQVLKPNELFYSKIIPLLKEKVSEAHPSPVLGHDATQYSETIGSIVFYNVHVDLKAHWLLSIFEIWTQRCIEWH